MKIKIGEVDVELRYTFNSFKYMREFDINEINDIQSKPFKLFAVLSELFYGAVNHNPSIVVSKEESDTMLQEYVSSKDCNIGEFINKLFEMLTENDFFKQLQA